MTPQRDFLNPPSEADFMLWCGSSQRSARRYLSGEAEVPVACDKILRLVRDGILPFPELDQVRVSAEGIFLPGWDRPFSPGELRAHFWRVQQLAELRRTVQKMKNEVVDPAPRNIEVVVFEDGVEIGRQQLAA
jgi:hypothetical protein